MKLYEIDLAMEALVDPETGEIMDYDAFAALAMAREEKIDNTALWIKNLDAEQAALDVEAHNLMARRDMARRKRDRLKEYLQTALDGEKRSTPQYAISYRASEAVEISDEAAASSWLADHGYTDGYIMVKTSVSKSGVKDLIRKGMSVPGADLIRRQNMTIK